MNLDLAGLRRQGGKQRYHFEETVPPQKIDYENIRFLAPVTAEVEAVNTGTIILVNLVASTVAELECSRCLAPITYPLQLKQSLAYVHQEDLAKLGIEITPGEESEDYQVFDDRPVDLGDLVIENMLVSLPMKPICKEGCRGICPDCGSDLNREECKCRGQKVDPRLEVLRGLLGSSD